MMMLVKNRLNVYLVLRLLSWLFVRIFWGLGLLWLCSLFRWQIWSCLLVWGLSHLCLRCHGCGILVQLDPSIFQFVSGDCTLCFLRFLGVVCVIYYHHRFMKHYNYFQILVDNFLHLLITLDYHISYEKNSYTYYQSKSYLKVHL